MSERDEYRRRFYCKMTCEGGSERGLCECFCPDDCTSSNHDIREAGHRMINRFKVDVATDDALRFLRSTEVRPKDG